MIKKRERAPTEALRLVTRKTKWDRESTIPFASPAHLAVAGALRAGRNGIVPPHTVAQAADLNQCLLDSSLAPTKTRTAIRLWFAKRAVLLLNGPETVWPSGGRNDGEAVRVRNGAT